MTGTIDMRVVLAIKKKMEEWNAMGKASDDGKAQTANAISERLEHARDRMKREVKP